MEFWELINFLFSVSLLEILLDGLHITAAEVTRKNRSQSWFNIIHHANFCDVILFASVVTTNIADIPCCLPAG
jgi:hypothetical protein